VQLNRHELDFANRPLPFKIYTSLTPLALAPYVTVERSASASGEPAAKVVDLAVLARLCYFSNGITRVLRGMPFRAAACTGALFHIEQYLICADLADLQSGVYHFGAHDNGLRQLRSGDFRQVLLNATGAEPHVREAPVVMALTSTWWRNAWKYQSRAYRHAFWDSGTILSNLLQVAASNGIPATVVLGFADGEVNSLLDVDPQREATIALVALGNSASAAPESPALEPLNLPTRQLSHHEVSYPEIPEAHAASSLPSGVAAAAWRSQFQPPNGVAAPIPEVERVIARRGSSRRFTQDPIPLDALQTMLRTATSPFNTDAFVPTDLYLIVNAVDGLAPGSYVYYRDTRELELLKSGDFRREAAYLDLGQPLAGDAAVNVYSLVELSTLDDRAYRAAQLSAAIEAGTLYLSAYAQNLGATGLTFFDDDVTGFFSPHAAGKSVMFLTAMGVPARRR
jgi:SagB-type dehydrogenase family enzyme